MEFRFISTSRFHHYILLHTYLQSNTIYLNVLHECATEAFSTTCAVHIEDCECRWLSGCRNSVAEACNLSMLVSCWTFKYITKCTQTLHRLVNTKTCLESINDLAPPYPNC